VDTITPVPAAPKHWRALLAALTLLFGMGTVVVWNWYVLDKRQEQESQRRFERDSQAIAELIQTRMRSYEMVLRGVSTAFSGPQPTHVGYAQWQHIVAQLRVQELYPGISSVVWSRYLRANELDSWLNTVRADGRPDFNVFPPGKRENYQIIHYIGPLNERTASVVGMDILSQPNQRSAVQLARDSGKAVLSMPLPDLYPSSADSISQMGLIMYFPVYRTGKPPDTLQARQADLIGMTNAVFRGQELVDSIFGPLLHSFRIQAHDTQTDQMLFDSHYIHKIEAPTHWQPHFQTTLGLSLYGRTWHVTIASNPDYESALLSRSQDLILLMGLSTSVLVALLGGAFVYQRDRQMYGREKAALKLRNQAQQLMLANRYKTEFLANMSHELRTPLNSILILSDQLRKNTSGNLHEKQIKHADIVYRAGNDLLQLINDVLDLAKIEAGRIHINLEALNLQDILVDLDAALRPLAESKKLHLYIPAISAESGVPLRVYADRGRLHQILRNLLSNAIKFTDEGQVSLTVGTGQTQADGRIILSFAVRDTGIGIDPAQHEQVFEAFAQLDGSTRRRFGGTGLGLPITRQLVKALEGDIQLHSAPGQGSTFTVYLPVQSVQQQEPAPIRTPQRTGEGPALLIVEDDANFASIIIEQAQVHGFSSVHCSSGQHALELLSKERFAAIILDILLPDISGWQLFRRLRAQNEHRYTPVHIISCLPQPNRLDIEHGTHYLTKPIGQDALEQVFSSLQQCQHPSHGTPLLLVEDVEAERQHYQQQLNALGFAVTACENAQHARTLWSNCRFDVLVIDLNLPDQDGFSLLESLDAVRSLSNTRLIINTGLDVSQAGLQRLTRYSAVVVHKQGADIAALGQAVQGFLGQINLSTSVVAKNTDNIIETNALVLPMSGRNSLQGQRVLLVDDDVRNVYAMSAVLDGFGLCIHTASNGEEAIACFKQTPLDLILMDMSMPVMDGYTATHLLKTQYACTLPIIALTAHAMKGDREKCLAAGADDYLSKPVEGEQLRALLERWLLNATNE